MSGTGLVRRPSRRLAEGIVTHVAHAPVDLAPARAQHAAYADALAANGWTGSGPERGTVFFLGGGFLELSGRAAAPPAPGMALWLQVRELAAARRELGERGVRILRGPKRGPKREPWGLLEMWIADPDGVRICIVEVPEDHPLRHRD